MHNEQWESVDYKNSSLLSLNLENKGTLIVCGSMLVIADMSGENSGKEERNHSWVSN